MELKKESGKQIEMWICDKPENRPNAGIRIYM